MRLDDVETFHDFQKLLKELSNLPDGGFFYLPLYMKFNELMAHYKWMLRLSLIFGFILGLIAGALIP